ncbi:MAG: S8 family peptidase [Chloroflexi bacterium]|nr:S8 family peptidase [Chloroflexota bacterium]
MSDPGFELSLDSLENRKQGIEVACVREENGISVATVHVPAGEMSFFLERIEKYETENTKWGKPKNARLIESIANIKLAAVRSFWTDEKDLYPQDDQAVWWEVWLRCPRGEQGQQVLSDFRQAVDQTIRLDSREVRFEERAVLLAWCEPRDWSNHPALMDRLAELRKAKEPVGPYVRLAPRDQAAFIDELLSRITPPNGDAPAVCILDTGVDWGHPLIAAGMDQASALSVDPNWRTNDHDGHGTEVAGLGLYGCLAAVLSSAAPVVLTHCLESVKILPPPMHGANDPENYGAITQEAIGRAETAFPGRNRSVCLAVTTSDRGQGYPTSWSAAIDQLCSGDLDDKRRLVFVCAGNVLVLGPDYRYPETNRAQGVENPAQSWNAVTVGAYTDLVSPCLQGGKPVAPKGRLCPTSRTSMLWEKEWPIKPDIVMEGGNYATDASGRIDAADDLSLLTTARPIGGRLLTTSGDTSAAVALAARMGATIQSRYPALWSETVRGLMIHSAEWTPEMLAEFPDPQRKDRLGCYGWGVPQLGRALWSMENAVTLIYEGQLQPFEKVDGKVRTKDMHLHELPWPADVLQRLSTESVKMRVTLSYFIEPSPGQRGWTRKHRYQSHALRFDVKRATESLTDFRRRLSRESQEEEREGVQDEGATRARQGGGQPWALGRNLRVRGSIHSDWWEGTASELASCGCIGVFPVTGWWRERPHLGRHDRPARYSLIVSLETPRTDIDLYTAIATQVGIVTEIET